MSAFVFDLRQWPNFILPLWVSQFSSSVYGVVPSSLSLQWWNSMVEIFCLDDLAICKYRLIHFLISFARLKVLFLPGITKALLKGKGQSWLCLLPNLTKTATRFFTNKYVLSYKLLRLSEQELLFFASWECGVFFFHEKLLKWASDFFLFIEMITFSFQVC